MQDDQPPARPKGEYAIVEVLGHRTIIGRISEVARFGATLMSIEPIWQDALLPAALIGGSSIYQLTPCSADVAFARQPRRHYQLPPSIQATVPAPPAPMLEHRDEDDDEAPDWAPDFLRGME